jgi:hypothetical protein
MSLFLPGTDTLFESGLDNLIQHMRTNSVVSGCQVIAHVGPDMGVRVGAGTIQGLGSRVAVAQTDLVVAANGSGNNRFDLVHVDMGTGVPAIITGTPGASPKPPSLPANSIELAIVGVANAAVNIQNTNIGDRRLIAQASYAFPQVNEGGPDYVFIGGGTGNVTVAQAAGTSADVSLNYVSKGAGNHIFYTDGGVGPIALLLARRASSVNFIQIAGNVTGSAPDFIAAGSDTNIGLVFSSKGSGVLQFATGGEARNVLVMIDVAGAVNYFQMTGNTTGNPPDLQAVGTDGNIDVSVSPKGTGVFRFNYAPIAVTGGGVAALGGITGGPAAQAQSHWMKVKMGATVRYLAAWT